MDNLSEVKVDILPENREIEKRESFVSICAFPMKLKALWKMKKKKKKTAVETTLTTFVFL